MRQLSRYYMQICRSAKQSLLPTLVGVHILTPSLCWLLDRNYRYILATTQIPHRAGFAATPQTGQKWLSDWDITSIYN